MFLESRKRKTELIENGNVRLFAANGKRKKQTSVCFQQMERKTENKICFPWSASDKE
jgi:hypothetical protein